MTFDILTLFPEVFEDYFNSSIIGRAKKRGLIKIRIHNLRSFVSKNRPDARPYGGGPGMVIRIEPVIKALDKILKNKSDVARKKTKIIIFEASGKQFSEKINQDITKKYNHIILIAGHYEGIDERVKNVIKANKYNLGEISIGPYVLTGGEIPAMVVVDAISRKLKGVLGKTESLEEKRLGVGVPSYSRPEVFIYKKKKYLVPKVLLSGNHKDIQKWRLERKNK